MKSISRTALLASFWALSAYSLVSCTSGDPQLIYEDGTEIGATEGEPGSLKLALTTGGTQVNSVTAVIKGKHGFQSQTHNIDVSDGNGIISIFFGGLPEGRGYSIQLSAGQCTGTSSFNIQPDQTTLVSVILKCPGDDDNEHEVRGSGNVSVTGVIQGGGNPNAGCDHITKIVAAPSVQDGDGPTSTVEVVLNHNVVASSITWTTGSTTGGAGTISNQSGAADNQVNFDCTANGIVYLIADVAGPTGGSSCTEQARAAIDCRNQGPSLCGNGTINPPETCDGSVPAGQPAGTTCVNCQLVPPSTCNNNNVINPPEACDGTAIPATAPLGSTCPNCVLTHSCGNGAINLPEQCDGTVFPGSAPLGSSCNGKCELVHLCGNGVINAPEQCDGATLPSGQLGTCNARCQFIPTTTVGCGNGVIDGTDQCDGTVLPATAPLGATCTACVLSHQCNNGVVNPPEQCDGTARPAGTTGGTCDARCVLTGGTTATCGNGTIDGAEQCDGTNIPATAPLGATCANCTLSHQCNNGVVNPPEQCDGTARPAGTTGGTCDARCVLTGGTTATCGNGTIDGAEQCDGTNIPATAPLGATCTNCALVHQCNNGVVNPPEQCDGTARPAGTTGGTCDTRCVLTGGTVGTNECKACVEANCVEQRAVVDANLTTVDPILDCMLGTNWTDVVRVAPGSCSNADLLTCYCGTTSGQDCSNATPASLNGQCVQQVLTGTACTVSSCVAPIFLNPTNNNGKATQYIQCRQDFCFPECFNL